MELTVRKDLRRLGPMDTGVSASLAEAALILARAVDSYAKEAKTPAELSAIAKAIQELRTVLAKLVEGSDGDEPAAGDTTPVWDSQEPGPADAGPSDRGGGAPAG